jgi:hypothetical protein
MLFNETGLGGTVYALTALPCGLVVAGSHDCAVRAWWPERGSAAIELYHSVKDNAQQDSNTILTPF